MAKRKGISTKTRFEVFKRDGFTCQYCGGHPPAVVLHADHIVPVAADGGNGMDNLVTACDRCNLGKGARRLEAIPTSLKDRAAEVAEREAQVRGYSDVMAQQRERIEADAWEVADIYVDHFRKDGIRKDYLQSIRQFVEKLGVHECIQAMEVATSKKPWSQEACFRYFCGICWTIIREAKGA
jgi:hypothetical protein